MFSLHQRKLQKIKLLYQLRSANEMEFYKEMRSLMKRILKNLQIYIRAIDHSPPSGWFRYTRGNNKNQANCTSSVRPKEMKFYKEMRSIMTRITEKFKKSISRAIDHSHHQDVFATPEEITKIKLILPVAFGLKR